MYLNFSFFPECINEASGCFAIGNSYWVKSSWTLLCTYKLTRHFRITNSKNCTFFTFVDVWNICKTEQLMENYGIIMTSQYFSFSLQKNSGNSELYNRSHVAASDLQSNLSMFFFSIIYVSILVKNLKVDNLNEN